MVEGVALAQDDAAPDVDYLDAVAAPVGTLALASSPVDSVSSAAGDTWLPPRLEAKKSLSLCMGKGSG